MWPTENVLSQGTGAKRACTLLIGRVFLMMAVALVPSNQNEATEHSLSSPTAKRTPQEPAPRDQTTAQRQEATASSRQVLLDARVVVMKPGDLRELGTWRKVTLHDDESPGSVPASAGSTKEERTLSIQTLCAPDPVSTEPLLAALKDLEKRRRLEIVAHPQLVAMDGHEVLLRTIADEWFFMSVRTKGEAAPFIVCGSDLSRLEPDLGISIIPHVGDSNDIAIETAIEVSDRGGRRDTSHEPVVRRTERHPVTIQNGGTVAWAGLTRYHQREKPPSGLAKLPLIGMLFRNPKPSKPTEETVILMTAHVIPQPRWLTRPTQPRRMATPHNATGPKRKMLRGLGMESPR